MSAKKSFHKHIKQLQDAGHYTMHLVTGRVDVSHMCRSFQIYFGRKHPSVSYRFFWFRVEAGIVFCFSGNSLILDAVTGYMEKAVRLKTIGAAEHVYSGCAKSTFMTHLVENLTTYQPIFKQRSFGGSRTK